MSNSVCQNVAEAGSVGQSVIQSVIQSVGQSLSLSAVRLRRAERKQIQMMVRCVDDLVKPSHQVRAVAGVAAALDLSRFCEPIKARQGHAGRDATDPQLLVSLWLYGCIRGIGSARELARRCSADEGNAPFQWLCGGVTVNHHMLSDFRVEHADALDELFTQVVATLVDKGLVKVSRISQDGVRVRACAGASSFRREQRLEQLLEETRAHIAELRRQLDDPAQAAAMASKQSARQAAAKKRAAEEKANRLQQAIAQLPELKKKQQDAAKKAGSGKHGQKILDKEPRVSSTDPEARVMKMPNGGFNPAVNVQLNRENIVELSVVPLGPAMGSLGRVGHDTRQPRDHRCGGEQRRIGLGRTERTDAASGRAAQQAQREKSRSTSARRRLHQERRHRAGARTADGTVHAAQTREEPEQPRSRTGTQARRQRSDPGVESADAQRSGQGYL